MSSKYISDIKKELNDNVSGRIEVNFSINFGDTYEKMIEAYEEYIQSEEKD